MARIAGVDLPREKRWKSG